jgi:hypothetical protein
MRILAHFFFTPFDVALCNVAVMRTVARQNVTPKLLITPYKSIEKHLS